MSENMVPAVWGSVSVTTPAAKRVAIVPDEHRGPAAVERHVPRVEVVLEHAAARVGRDDHAESGQFLIAQVTDLASQVGHTQM
jgi:hypothetical protein